MIIYNHLVFFDEKKGDVSMRILELTLTGFLPILSGTGKESIHIDFRNSTDLITVLSRS